MAFRDIPSKIDFAAHEEEINSTWERERTFERSLEQRAGGSEYVFYDGPPFATGLPHYGHLLAGTIKDVGDLSEGDRRLDHPRFSGESIGKNVELLQALQDVAVAHGVAPAQVALAWVLASSERILPIPSTSTIAHLEENVAAAEIELAADEIETLGAVFAADAVAGDRYPPAALKKVQL